MWLEGRVSVSQRTPVCQECESASWRNNGLSQTDEWACVTELLRNLSKISKRPINSVHIGDQGHIATCCSKLETTVTGQPSFPQYQKTL